jgi:dipeptidyl aminopeptidase/acylaminoacyl peptidase
MRNHRLFPLNLILALAFAVAALTAEKPFTIEQVLSAPYVSDLVSARKANRIAWIEIKQGVRNVYTAVAPDFNPVRLTDFDQDDGTDLRNLSISSDGSVVVFVRGNDQNREGWIANPNGNPEGAERAVWAVRVRERKPFKLARTDSGRAPVTEEHFPAEDSRLWLSPDGRFVLFVKEGQIYEVTVLATTQEGYAQVAGGRDAETQPLIKAWGTNGSPSWSPDGKKIAFVSDRKDHSLIGIYDHQARTITYLAPSVDKDTSPTWSPDGRRLAFVRQPGSSPSQLVSSAPDQRAPGGVPDLREQPKNWPTGPGWVQARFEEGHTLEFWTADPDTGKGERSWRNPVNDPSYSSARNVSIRWAGNNIVFRLERNNWQHYYSIPIGTLDATPIDLTPGEGEAESVGFSADGKYLYYSTNVNDIDRRHLWKTPTAGGNAVELTTGEGIETHPAVLANEEKVAVLYAGSKQPMSVALVPSIGGNASIISPALPREFPGEELVVPQQVILTAKDGLKFHCQLFVPKDIRPGERQPAIVFTHGGPGRQMLLGYHYDYFYNMAYGMNEYFANKGYVVISVNYRGGIGYGREFRMAANRGAQGSSEYQDLYAAGKYLQSRPDVDPRQIGLYGLSYGGLMTAMGLSRNSDLFAAGVDIAGVHLFVRSLDTKSVAFKASPVATIDKWTSPVLLIQGDDDRNVDFAQTVGMVQLLRARKVHYELIVFPDEVHVFLMFKKWLITFNAADDFFDRFLLKKQAALPVP